MATAMRFPVMLIRHALMMNADHLLQGRKNTGKFIGNKKLQNKLIKLFQKHFVLY